MDLLLAAHVIQSLFLELTDIYGTPTNTERDTRYRVRSDSRLRGWSGAEHVVQTLRPEARTGRNFRCKKTERYMCECVCVLMPYMGSCHVIEK